MRPRGREGIEAAPLRAMLAAEADAELGHAKAISFYRKIVKSLRGTQGYERVYRLVLQILGDEPKDVEEFEAFIGQPWPGSFMKDPG